MPSKKENQEKSEHDYLMHFSEAEWQRHKNLQKKYGFTTFSSLVRRVFDIAGQNPSLLHEFKFVDEQTDEHMVEILETIRSQMGADKPAQEEESCWKASVDKKLDILMRVMADTPEKKQAVKKALNEIDDVEVVFDD